MAESGIMNIGYAEESSLDLQLCDRFQLSRHLRTGQHP
jgi:hypothetical protein